MSIVMILHWSVKSELLTNSCYEDLLKRIVSWKVLVSIVLNNCICRKWKIVYIQVMFFVMSVCFFACAVVFSVVYSSVSSYYKGSLQGLFSCVESNSCDIYEDIFILMQVELL
jgi:hypothetical protein